MQRSIQEEKRHVMTKIERHVKGGYRTGTLAWKRQVVVSQSQLTTCPPCRTACSSLATASHTPPPLAPPLAAPQSPKAAFGSQQCADACSVWHRVAAALVVAAAAVVAAVVAAAVAVVAVVDLVFVVVVAATTAAAAAAAVEAELAVG